MDQSVLVTSGSALVKAMDNENIPPQIAMWVHSSDTDIWKLWIVPPNSVSNKHDFYRRLATIMSKHRSEIGSLSMSDVEMMSLTHPAMQGIGQFFRIEGLGSVHFSGNRFNNFYLPDGIILRSKIERRAKPRP